MAAKKTPDQHKGRMVRIPHDLHAQMSTLANRNDRPLTREIARALAAWIAQQAGNATKTR